jgi:hypothetical protein
MGKPGPFAVAAIVAQVAAAGCGPPATPAAVVIAPPVLPACSARPVALSGDDADALLPSVAGRALQGDGGVRWAFAWLELGEAEAVRVTVVDGEGRTVRAPTVASDGLRGLGAPRIAVSTGGFTLAFSGRDSREREGVAITSVSVDGAVAPASLVIVERGARVLALADAGGPLVGWYVWDADAPTVRLSHVATDGSVRTAPVARAPFSAAMQLLPVGGEVRALWVAAETGAGGDTVEVAWRGAYTIAGEGPKASAPPLRLTPGGAPSLAVVDGAERLLVHKPLEGRLWQARLAGGALVEEPAPDGELGVIATSGDGALACVSIAGPPERAATEDLRCARLDGTGRAREWVTIARGFEGVTGLSLATTSSDAALAWQHDSASSGSTVRAAIVRCR